MTDYSFITETVVGNIRPLRGAAGGGISHDLPGHPVPGHACLGGALVTAHLQADDVLSLAKLLL